jgi:hypothetical protein
MVRHFRGLEGWPWLLLGTGALAEAGADGAAGKERASLEANFADPAFGEPERGACGDSAANGSSPADAEEAAWRKAVAEAASIVSMRAPCGALAAICDGTVISDTELAAGVTGDTGPAATGSSMPPTAG